MSLLPILFQALFNKALFTNIRFYVLLFSFSLFLGIHFYLENTLAVGTREIVATQTYAFIAVGFLYLALLVGPLSRVWGQMPFRSAYLKARRSLGVSAFSFGILHGYNAFFHVLGGFNAFWTLPLQYYIALVLSSITLFILTAMAATSFDAVIKKMTFPKWKRLHQLIYIGGISIVIHAALLGEHVGNFGSLISTFFFAAVAFLLLLHAMIHFKK